MTDEIGQSYLKQNLRYLLILRGIAIGTQIVALLFMQYAFQLEIPLLLISVLILLLAIYTIYSWVKVNKKTNIASFDYMFQLIVDMIVLSVLVYLTGGSTNPFIFFFLLPIIFAAASLNFKQTCIIAGLAIASYTTLMFYHVPLLKHAEHHEGFDLHVWGMWYGFLVSAVLVSYFVSRIGTTLRKRNLALAKAREENLKAAQVLSLGTLAAGTAHELGTPLSTMAILAKEMEYEHQDNQETLRNLQLLRDQIDRCKTILSRMAVDAGTAHAESGGLINIEQYLQQLFDDWQESNSQIDISTICTLKGDEINIIADTTLTQSITNVLNNAVEAAEQQIEFNAVWDQQLLNIEILDDGKGVDPSIMVNINQPTMSNKQPRGLGIGLFLAQITLNRLGGQLEIKNREQKGTCVTIQLPLNPITSTA